MTKSIAVTWAILPVFTVCAVGLAVVGQPGIGAAMAAGWLSMLIYSYLERR